MSRRAWSVFVPVSFMVLASPWAGCLDAPANGTFPEAGTFDVGSPGDFDASGFVDGPGKVDSGSGSVQVQVQGDATPGGAIDFGPVDCGGAAPAAKSATVKNVGTAPLAWSASLGTTTAFTLTGLPSGTLAPGASATLAITAKAVPATATAGAVAQATLTLTTDDAAHKTIDIPVRITPSGATLVAAPAMLDFGTLPLVKTELELPVDLKNTGNAPITLDVVQPTDAQFTFDWTGSPASLTIAPGASAAGLKGKFKPTATLPASGAAGLKPTGAICGASATTIPVSGLGTNGVAGVQPGALDFGKVDCGATAPAQEVRVSNAGNGQLTFTAALGANSAYTVSPLTGVVAGGATAVLTVTPKAIPATSLTTADLYADSLTITTDAFGDAPHVVPLHETAQGARLAFNTPAVSFGEVPVSQTPDNPFTVTNDGNVAATVTLSASGAPFGVSPSAPGSVSAGGNLPATASFAPTTVGAQSGTVTIATSDVLCAPLPAPLTLSGTGTLGAIAISTGDVDFGAVDCGTAAQAQTFTVTNTGTATFTWNAALLAGTAHAVSPASGTLTAGQVATLTVTPSAVPGTSALTPNLYGDTVRITTNIPGDSGPHDVAVHESARGAVLRIAPPSIAFNATPVSTPANAGFSVINDGNAPASVSLTSSNAVFKTSAATVNAIAGGGGTSALTATYTPVDTSTQNGTVTLAPIGGTVLCQPLPAPLALSGSGTNGVASIGPSSISFGNAGQVDCGTRAASQSVTIANTGNGAITYTATLGGSNYTLSKTTGTVAGGSSDSVVVQPIAIPAASATTADLYADTLTVAWTTLSGVTTDTTVALHMTAHGAILAWQNAAGTAPFTGATFGNVPINTTPTQPFSVRNTGNAAASVGFTSTDPNFTLAVQSGTVTTTSPGTVTFAPKAIGAYTSTAALTVVAGTVLCGALPGSVQLTGTGTNGVPVIPTTPLDFGVVSCGGAPNGTRTVTVRNSGNQPFTITPTLGASVLPFTIVSPTGATPVPGNGSVDVVVSGPAINAPANTAAGFYDGSLLITTSGAQGDTGNPHVVPLKLSAQGSILAWVDAQGAALTTVDFGDVGLNPQPIPSRAFALRNTGNLAPTVTIGLAGSTEFGAAPQGQSVPANGALNGTFTFNPVALGQANATAILNVTSNTASCGGAVGTVAVSGRGTNAIPQIPTTPLAFGTGGLVSCGSGAPAPLSVTLGNGGNTPYTFTATVIGAALPYTLSASTGSVAPGTPVTLNVTAPAINAPANTTAGFYNATLRIVTTGATGDTNPHDIPLQMTADGAILGVTVTSPFTPSIPGGINYGAASGSQSGVLTFTNSGTLAAQVGLVNSDTATFSWKPVNFAVNAGATGLRIAGIYLPGTNPTYADTLTFSVSGPVCSSSLPAQVHLEGLGLQGQLVLTAAPPNFGEVCSPETISPAGAPIPMNPSVNTGLRKTFTLTNRGNLAVTWGAANNMSQAGLFQIVGQPQTTLNPGDVADVTVQPLDVAKPAGAYNDSFVLNSSSGPGVTVPLAAQANGIAWSFSVGAFVMPAGTTVGTVRLLNNGNIGSEALTNVTDTSGAWITRPGYVPSLPAGGAATLTLVLNRQIGASPWPSTLTSNTNIQVNPAMCAKLPTLPLSGQ